MYNKVNLITLLQQDKTLEEDLRYIYSSFKDAKEYGSILDIKNINFNSLFNLILNFESNKNNLNRFKYQNEIQTFKNLLNQARILSKNYDVVITNPPYMGSSGMNANLKDYLKKNFPNSKSDLFAVFIEKCHDFSKSKGFVAMITQQSFMFLSTFENLRVNLINNHTIIDMAHLGAHAFEEIGGEVVQATSFINKNNFIENYNSTFHRLIEFNSESKKEQEFHNDKNIFYIKLEELKNVPGTSLAYWINEGIINSFKNGIKLGEIANAKVGLQTGNTKRFLRYWHEIDYTKFRIDKNDTNLKWVPHNKGGSFRRWYGNQEYVINWDKDGNELKNYEGAILRNSSFYFKEFISWSSVSTGKISFRFFNDSFLFDIAGGSVFCSEKLMKYLLALLNSNITQEILDIISPTINYSAGYISLIPIIHDKKHDFQIEELVDENIGLCKNDWDDYELSWNFSSHPFVRLSNNNLQNIFSIWEKNKQNDANKLYQNEIELNEIFDEIYNIKTDYVIHNNEISISCANLNNDVKSFVSYAVGCMFGRYSLDNEGLQFAGGNFNINNYHKFIPDDDNIIPVLDSEYFEDDIVGMFVEFVKICFGEETLEENLDFIANALTKNKKRSREKIREYLLKNFFNDHKKTYKKCPIYWQFSSGKQNGFNCLVYMHRYEPSLVARIRTDYLHKTQKAIEQAISNCDNIINHSSSNTEIARATKDKNKLQKQLQETQEYDEALAHIANQKIEIDLDDGVKVNYAKFQNVEVSREGKKSKKINLLKKL